MTDSVNQIAELIYCYPQIKSFRVYEKDHLVISYLEKKNFELKEFKSDNEDLAIIHLLRWVEANLTERKEFKQLEQ